MTKLSPKAVTGLARMIALLAVAIFVPAWTLDYWQGWVYLIIFGGSVTAITYFLSQTNPELVEKRLNASPNDERDEKQKSIHKQIIMFFFGGIALSAFDPWSELPALLVAFGEILVLAGFGIIYLVLKENPFAGSTIEVVPEQKVIHSGPYSVVRHPLYSGAILLFAGTPLALSSWLGILAVPFLIRTIMQRVTAEEKLLVDKLPGYEEYEQQVKDRIIPSVW